MIQPSETSALNEIIPTVFHRNQQIGKRNEWGQAPETKIGTSADSRPSNEWENGGSTKINERFAVDKIVSIILCVSGYH